MKNILISLVDYFPDLMDVNVTASIVILFVICIRLLMKRSPKIFSYALWSIVLLRLLVPFSLESSISVLPEQTALSSMVEVNEVLPEIKLELPQDHADNQWHRENTPPGEPLVQTSRSLNPEAYLTFVWLLGIGVMLVRSGVSYWKLRRKVRVSIPLQKGILIADDIDTPFVMGFFRPVIYLPGTLEPMEQSYIIAHERHHIRRGDHFFKALGFLALTIHWFNPLVWVAFILAGRDMELSCDEAVIRKLGEEVRADYSASLLKLATGQRMVAGIPLTFGEGDPVGRVRNLAKWKRPAAWVVALCLVIFIVAAVCLLTDPQQASLEEAEIAEINPSRPIETPPTEVYDWDVSIVPVRVFRTGATITFDYPSAPSDKQLYYDGYLLLEKMQDGSWITVLELSEYEGYAKNSGKPVTDGLSVTYSWPEQLNGQYRLGKRVYLNPGRDERILYSEFSIPEDLPTELLPLEDLPKYYSTDQARSDGYFVQHDGIATGNKALFQEFATVTQGGTPSFLRIVSWDFGPKDRCSVFDLDYDGSLYTISWLEKGQRCEKQFRYLMHFEGEKEQENMAYDAYEHYVLVNDSAVTWPDIWNSLISPQKTATIDHMTVYSDYTYHGYAYEYDTPELLDNIVQADLEFEGETLVTVTDADRLEAICHMFDTAEILNFAPKTHSTGLGLHLILTGQNSEQLTVDLDLDTNHCYINGDFIHYGVYDEQNYIIKLWKYLGISAWPDPVYEKYPSAYR